MNVTSSAEDNAEDCTLYWSVVLKSNAPSNCAVVYFTEVVPTFHVEVALSVPFVNTSTFLALDGAIE